MRQSSNQNRKGERVAMRGESQERFGDACVAEVLTKLYLNPWYAIMSPIRPPLLCASRFLL